MTDTRTALPQRPWHALDPAQTLAALDSPATGLSEQEAQRRLTQYGPNRLPAISRRSALRRFLLQFHNVLIYVLLGAAVVTGLLGEWVDMSVILGVVLINALIGFIQEGKAEKALDAIRGMLTRRATVLRDGHRVELPAEDLVPGDIVLLHSGDKVPADLRLIKIRDLRIEEAVLTGESVPVDKALPPVDEEAALGDRSSLAFSSTLVTYGQGTGIVVATGARTEIGRISAMLEEVQTLTTPLLRKMSAFGRWLTVAILVLAGLTFAFGILLRGYTAVDMFMAAVGLAVAAIPEGLPAVMTITLAIGVQRMARRNAIIRRLPAVETLGAVTIICSDKTGTLTRNEMTVQTVLTASRRYDVTGAGYRPRGSFLVDGEEIEPSAHTELEAMLRVALLCNDARLHERDGEMHLHGDPTEGALLAVAMKAGLDPAFEHEERPRTDAIPFESEHRFMATLHHDHAGHGFIYLKGAPERVLQMCNRQRVDGVEAPLDLAFWHAQIAALAVRGQRVLAAAFRPSDKTDQEQLHFADVEGGLALLGLFGIIDPPREEAIRAVAECRSAGIQVKMITGDHALTARAIGAQMGIGDGTRALTGPEIEDLDADQLRRAALEHDVFARAAPEHKLRLVQALQAEHHVVAMTGDGVNDAPALKRAEVGVAMGIKGTEAAKEAAEMVLADDNFASIAHAVEEGRTVYDNLKKSILFILPTNGGQAFVIITAIVFGMVLPITPVQILWVNMISAVTLGLSLAFEPAEADIMRRPPRPPREPLLSGFLLWRIAFVSLLLVIATFVLFLWKLETAPELEAARTMAVNTLVMAQIFYLFSARYIYAPSFSLQGLFGSRSVLLAIGAVLVFQLLFTYAPPMQRLFHTAALPASDWLWMIGAGILVFVLVELEKRLVHRRRNHRATASPPAP